MKKNVLLLFSLSLSIAGFSQLNTPGGTVGVSGNTNVGLNTTAPAHDVDVHDAGQASLRLLNTSSSRQLVMRSSGSQYIEATNDFFVQSDYNLVLAGSASPFATNHGILFGTQSPLTYKMLLTAAGDLGIGTLAPITRVHTDGYFTSDLLTSGTGTIMSPSEGIIVANGVGTFSERIDFTGNPMEYLSGDGTWQPAGGGVSDFDWDYNGFDISTGYVNGPYAQGTVNIGTGPGNSGKLNLWHRTDAAYPHGMIAEIYGQTPGTSVGIDLRNSTLGPQNIGVQAGVTAANLGYGGIFFADGWSSSMQEAYGIQAFGNSAQFNNFGGYFTAFGGQDAYGVYCEGNGAVNSNWALYANGDTYTPGAMWTSSDRKLKDNIQNLENISDRLMEINPRSYTFRQDEFPSMNLPSGAQYGVISQELREVFPEFVKEVKHPAQLDKEGNIVHESFDFLAVSYDNFIPLLIKAHQEQQAEIVELRAQIEDLIADESAARESVLGSPSASNDDAHRVLQNYPNPFNESTTIGYEIASGASEASILVYDVQGGLKMNFNGLTLGKGSVKVDARSLTPGIYAYVLIVDGKQVDSKQMIITK